MLLVLQGDSSLRQAQLSTLWVKGGEEDVAFSGVLSIAVSSDGRCFVLDRTESLVYVFDDQGNLKSQFGQKGTGPGEFREPDAIAFDGDNNLHVMDTSAKKVVVKGADGSFRSEQKLPLNVQKVYTFSVTAKQQYIVSCMRSDANFRMRYELVRFSPDFEQEQVFYSKYMPKMESFLKQGNNPAYWVTFLQNRTRTAVEGVPLMAAIDGNRIAVSAGQEQKGLLVDAMGQTVGKFEREVPPTPFPPHAHRLYMESIWTGMQSSPFLARRVTNSVFETAVAKVDLPTYLPSITTMFPLNEGFVVIEGYDIIKKRGKLILFDRNGVMQQSLPYEGPLGYFAGHKNRLYLGALDDEDIMTLTCFKLGQTPSM